jgi:arsenate reductase
MHLMTLSLLLTLVFALTTGLASASTAEITESKSADLYPDLAAYLDAREAEFDEISAERRKVLDELASYVRRKAESADPAELIFVCTHNSRRSHMSQIWAAAAAAREGVRIWTYSGGTESTAFNPRAVASIQRAGVRIEKTTDANNPVYHARISDDLPAMTCFSKPYDNDPNPKKEFGAVMVCTDADEACPFVPGAEFRLAVPFVDPKVSDGTPAEAVTYDERCAQIAREMLYVMSRAAG